MFIFAQMEFRTVVETPRNMPSISHQDNLMLLGSCFAENMGKQLVDSGFRCEVNPFGILYNPLSVANALNQMLECKEYTSEDLFFHRGLYNSFMHHGSFSNPDISLCLSQINDRISRSNKLLSELDYLLVTFGTAWVYRTREAKTIVSNCHKLPASKFIRYRLTVEEITEQYNLLISHLVNVKPDIKIIFTVSPIRHIKDGMHENQVSKATLLLAIEEIVKQFPKNIIYFPSYEIVLDELRDYRFYADDMLHPSAMAVNYIWERFSETFFNRPTRDSIKEYENIRRDINHKPFNPGSDEYKFFLEQIVLKINRFKGKYPNFEVQKDLDICLTRLKELPA